MIPKIVHFCSFGNTELSTNKKWIEALPGYIFIRWNEANFKLDQHPYAAKVYELGRIDLLENYVKIWALSNFGGIALTNDIVIKKSFDDLLELPYVFGYDTDNLTINGDIFASCAGYKFFNEMLEVLNSLNDEELDITITELVYTTLRSYGYYFFAAETPDMFVESNKYITLFDRSLFSPLDFDEIGRITNNTCNENTYALNFFKGNLEV